MNPNGLHLLLGFIAATACAGWVVEYRRATRAERQRDIAERVAAAKNHRLMTALDERDLARRHADDAQWLANSIITGESGARTRHPSGSNVRVLAVVPETAS